MNRAGKLPVILLFLVLLLVSSTGAQTPLEILSPTKTGLLEIRFPDLTGVESGVREHLLALQTSLAKLAKTPTPDAQLSEAYGELAQTYQAYSLTPPAEACYQNAHRLSPKDFRWVYLLGSLYQQTNRADEAIKFFKLAQQLRPDYLAAWVNAGTLLLQQNRADEAVAAFNQALKLNDQSVAAHFGLGQSALAGRNYSAAVERFERALALAPEANRINYSLAMAYRGLGNLDKAQSFLERQGSVGIRVTDPLVDGLQDLIRGERLFLARGRRAFDAKRFVEAAEAFKQAVAANPESVPALINLGSTLAELGKAKEAIEQFQAALKLAPSNVSAHYNLGVLMAGQKQHEQAIAHFQTVLKQNPSDTEARFKLANQFFQLRRFTEAATELAQVVEADPNNEMALLELAKLQQRNQQFKAALETLERGHKLFPNKGQTASLLAYWLATTPQLDLRNGARASELAKQIYQTTGSANHGTIVALALAESGRCAEAAEWQRRMIAVAETERNADLLAKLKAELPRYENVKICRP
ncbi:MAG: tetratricopeptide repeat protein [Blastocatellia bacterium]